MGSRVGSDQRGRTALFAVAAVAALLLAVPFSMWLSRAPASLTQTERLGAEIGCACGTCPLRPIATCGCGFADGMLARLDQEISAGRSDDEIMATFVAEYGSAIKIKPAGSGVGLMAWLAPMAFLMVGAVVVGGVISHWRTNQSADGLEGSGGRGGANVPSSEAAASAEASAQADRYRDIVERELDALDD
jgi:cytochrome c-type biogenesis protein CcmH